MKIYHISAIENKESILANGLISEDSEIFVCTNLEHLKSIALNQLFISEYSIFEISQAGITCEMEADEVAEIGAESQFILRQDKIDSEHIKFLNDAVFNIFDLAEEDNLHKAKALGFDETEYIEDLVSRNSKWCDHYNKKYNKSIIPIQV